MQDLNMSLCLNQIQKQPILHWRIFYRELAVLMQPNEILTQDPENVEMSHNYHHGYVLECCQSGK
jgi:hypothetical protein